LHFNQNDYEVVDRELLYQGVFRMARYLIKHRLFDGGWSELFSRELMERYSASAVLPYDPKTDRVILIEQFRPGAISNPVGPWLLEIPAGVITGKETPEQVAHHEAQEEAGCILQELIPIYEFYVSPGGSNEYLNLYCGRVDSSNIHGVHGLDHEHENILVHNVTYDQAILKLNNGEIKTTPAIIALLWLQLNRDKLRTAWK